MSLSTHSPLYYPHHRAITATLNGLLPKVIAMREVRTVLDVGCGIGEWAVDVVRRYPWLQVVGIDIDEHVLTEARRITRFAGVHNISFQHMDATKTLAFGNAAFDIVHMRFATFLSIATWPTVVADLVRVLRPGGWLYCVELEPGITSSAAFNRLQNLELQAVGSVDEDAMNLATRQPGLLLNAYLLDVSQAVYAFDFQGHRMPGESSVIQDMLAAAQSWKLPVCQHQLVTMHEYDALLQRAESELTHPAACGYAYLFTTVGRKYG